MATDQQTNNKQSPADNSKVIDMKNSSGQKDVIVCMMHFDPSDS